MLLNYAATMKRVVLITLCFAELVAWASAMYTLEARVHQFNNPGGREFDGDCCEPICGHNCDYYFSFCLRPMGFTQSLDFCPYNSEFYSSTANPIHNANPTISFTIGQNIAQGIPNPLTFTQGWDVSGNRGFQLLAVIRDSDGDTDDLIDRVIVNRVLEVSDSFTSQQDYSGEFNRATLRMSFQVTCNTNYYGQDCTVFCESRDDTSGHYGCDSNGDRFCLEGWTDLANDCTEPICLTGCDPPGGLCNNPGECTCNTDWVGALCDQCVPPSDCVHGTCNSPGECNCLPGYSGQVCQRDDQPCEHQTPCVNGAACTNIGPDEYECQCLPGYTGVNCETDIDDCASLPCRNGMCEDGVNSFTCECEPGWTGALCDTDINECLSSPCNNSGTCENCNTTLPIVVDPDTNTVDAGCPNGYICNCTFNFFGENCDFNVDFCLSNPCQNGDCQDMLETYTCICAQGYTGRNCDVEINECQPSPCENGGNCTDMVGNYSCTCPGGFTDRNCQTNIDDCVDNECNSTNTQMCEDGINSYECVCHPGYTGQFCEVEIDECDSSPCQNGATCMDLFDDFTCQCLSGFTGVECSVNIDDCHRDLCLNDGTCIDGVNSYSCACVGFTGSQCETILPCASNPCEANQMCVEQLDGATFTCVDCQPGFTGSQCEINLPCASNPCGANQMCVEQLDGATFTCVDCQPEEGGCPIGSGSFGSGSTNESQGGKDNLGGIIGGAVAAAIALFLLIAILLCVCCWCCYTHGVCEREKVVEEEVDISYRNTLDGAVMNHMYFSPDTLASQRSTMSSQRGTLPMEQTGISGDRSIENRHYFAARPPLPPRNDSFSPSVDSTTPFLPSLVPKPSEGRKTAWEEGYPDSDDTNHYERIPFDDGGLVVPGVTYSDGYAHLAETKEGKPPILASGKYDHLTDQSPLLANSSREETPIVVRRMVHPPPTPDRAENPYVVSPDLPVALPSMSAQLPASEAKNEEKVDLNDIDVEMPSSTENPYDTI